MNITEPLPDTIELEYHDELWHQPIDYEHIPFHCRRCHEYGHLFRECPITLAEKEREAEKGGSNATRKIGEEEEDFREVQRRRRRGSKKMSMGKQKETQKTESLNMFKLLHEEGLETEASEEEEIEGMEVINEKTNKETDNMNNEQGVEILRETQEDQGDMEIDLKKTKGEEEEQVMARLLQEWKRIDQRFIPEEQKQRYKEAFQRYKEKKRLTEEKENKKSEKQETQSIGEGSIGKGGKKRGRRTMSEMIQEVGEMLVNSGRVIPLSEVFQSPPKLLR